MTGANTPAEIANAIDNLTLGIPGPFNVVNVDISDDGNTFTTMTSTLTSTSGSNAKTKYTRYFSPKDYCAFLIAGNATGSSCRFSAKVEKSDGTEIVLIPEANYRNSPDSKVIFSPLALEDQDSTYRLKIYYKGYYYNGSTQTQYFFPLKAITARTLLQS